jgi:hypothetical protein
MNAVEVSRGATNFIKPSIRGPENNPGVYATSLSIISRMKAAADGSTP